jgi:hypothetical protein
MVCKKVPVVLLELGRPLQKGLPRSSERVLPWRCSRLLDWGYAQLHASIGVPGEGPLGFNAKATSQEEGFVPYAQEYFDKLDAGVGCSSKVFKHANECASQRDHKHLDIAHEPLVAANPAADLLQSGLEKRSSLIASAGLL